MSKTLGRAGVAPAAAPVDASRTQPHKAVKKCQYGLCSHWKLRPKRGVRFHTRNVRGQEEFMAISACVQDPVVYANTVRKSRNTVNHGVPVSIIQAADQPAAG
jgi:hypothetical protein